MKFPKQQKWFSLLYNTSFIQIYKNNLALKVKCIHIKPIIKVQTLKIWTQPMAN